VYLLDDNRRSIGVSHKTTGKQLVQQIAEKLNLTDCDFFNIAEVMEHGGTSIFIGYFLILERWIKPNIPVLQQGINSGSKLVFKARLMYYDSAELSDSMAVYLYYIQVFHSILF
jgi:hypothetical protein